MLIEYKTKYTECVRNLINIKKINLYGFLKYILVKAKCEYESKLKPNRMVK